MRRGALAQGCTLACLYAAGGVHPPSLLIPNRLISRILGIDKDACLCYNRDVSPVTVITCNTHSPLNTT
jgi:hypothetical protein